jgi:hypothetical protein
MLVLLNTPAFSQVQQWKVFTTSNSTVPGDYFYCLGLDKDQNIWLAAHSLAKWDKVNPTTYLQYPDLGSDIVSVVGDSNGYVWVSLEAPWIIKTNGTDWETHHFTGNMWPITIDIHNNLWGGAGYSFTPLNGLYKYDGLVWTVYDTINSGLPYPIVNKVTSDVSGKIWGLAQSKNSPDKALFSFNGTIWNSYPTIYSHFWIGKTMTADRKGNIWYATGYPEEGIVQFDGTDFIFHPAPDSTLFFPTALAIDISDNLWVCWENGLAEYSGNNKWSVYKDSINYDFSDMVIDKQNNIWLSTFGDGVVLFNKNGIILSVDESKIDEIVNYFSLSQNYPNPFNPITKISWQSPVRSHQSLKIYDVLGNEVATLVNEFRNAGSYEVDFNSSSLSSGIYFYKLQAGDFLQTKKMILLK